jgi:AcrR family transcriptional regulator
MTRIPVEQRRRELVRAALVVMERDGVAAASTRAIVAEAGMSLGAFHYCFRSKQELLRELTIAVVDQERSAAAAVIRPGRDLHETLREGLRSWWKMIEDGPSQQQVLYELTQYSLRTPGMADLARHQYNVYRSSAAEVLAGATSAAGASWTVPLAVVAQMAVAMFDGVVLGWLVDRDSDRAVAVLDLFADHLLSLTTEAALPAGVASPSVPAGATRLERG